MASTMKALGIDRLSVAERITLVQEIWDSIVAEDAAPGLTETQRQELDRRIARLDADPGNVLTWDEIKDSVREGR
jgi:putative addiction module component (TIGR02574 family)